MNGEWIIWWFLCERILCNIENLMEVCESRKQRMYRSRHSYPKSRNMILSSFVAMVNNRSNTNATIFSYENPLEESKGSEIGGTKRRVWHSYYYASTEVFSIASSTSLLAFHFFHWEIFYHLTKIRSTINATLGISWGMGGDVNWGKQWFRSAASTDTHNLWYFPSLIIFHR